MRSAAVRADGFALTRSDDVDAVVIASHDSTHAELVLAAVKAGKPALSFCTWVENRWSADGFRMSAYMSRHSTK